MNQKDGIQSNVKLPNKYEKFGENFRYLTLNELQILLDNITNSQHKLMIRIIYELGCRVGEFVRIKLKDLDFYNNSIFFPAENTKTRQKRTSNISKGLMNDIKDYLKSKELLSKRDERLKNTDAYLFESNMSKVSGKPITENRIRQIFKAYIIKSGLDRVYGTDKLGRQLRKFTVHSLRHSHIMHYIHHYKLPVPIVQKQVGHKTLQATMTYCKPTDEMVKEQYEKARVNNQTFIQNDK